MKALLHAGALVDATDRDGYTPFHLSCAEGKMKIARILLLTGAEMSKVTCTGETGLDLALEHRHQNIIDLLRGWDPTLRERRLPRLDTSDGKLTQPPKTWSIYDVECFLQHIELPLYRSAFSEHEIDGNRLLGLTDAELDTELGITNTLHRTKILQEIGRLSLRTYKPIEVDRIDDFELPLKKSPTKLKPVQKIKDQSHLAMELVNARNLRDQLLRDVERASINTLRRPVNPRRRRLPSKPT